MGRPFEDLYKDSEKVLEYWKRTGAHSLDTKEFKALKKKMLYDHTWAITVDFFIEKAKLTTGLKVLDAGCGWGRTIIGLIQEIKDMDIVGVDITPELINLAKLVVQEETGEINKPHFYVGDIQNLNENDSVFDAVMSTRVLQYVKNPQKAISEFARVVKPGGRVVVAVPNRRNPLIYLRYHTKLYSPLDLEKWFKNAGLKILETGSFGYIPTVLRMKGSKSLVEIDRKLRKLWGLKNYGGLAMCVGEKPEKHNAN